MLAISYKTAIILILSTILFDRSFCTNQFNTSVCGYVQYSQIFYFINQAKSDKNIVSTKLQKGLNQNYTQIYNLCHQLQYWCEKQSKVVTGSMIAIDYQGYCHAFIQNRIQLIDQKNASSGLKVIYNKKSNNQTIQLNITSKMQFVKSITNQFPCKADTKVGCPSVSRTTIWTYFADNSIGYTVAIQVIGILFMILGVYMYRVTIVIIGWSTAFLILLAIQQTVVFIPGVPEQDLANVMIITIICSFFVGYVLAYFPKAGLFCMGMWVGLIITLTLNNVALYLIYSTPQNLPLYIVLPVLCVGFGVLTVCIKRKFIIFATSLIGAYVCLRALSWHLGAFPNELLYPEQYHLGLRAKVTWQFYLYVVALLILTASSSALQFWLFKKKVQKTNQSGDIDQHFDKMQNKLQNQRQNMMEFDNIFKKLKPSIKLPRILRKNQDNSQQQQEDQYDIKGKKKKSSYHKDSMSFDEQEQQQSKQQEEPLQQQQPQIDYKKFKGKKNDLQQNLLFKAKKNKR